MMRGLARLVVTAVFSVVIVNLLSLSAFGSRLRRRSYAIEQRSRACAVRNRAVTSPWFGKNGEVQFCPDSMKPSGLLARVQAARSQKLIVLSRDHNAKVGFDLPVSSVRHPRSDRFGENNPFIFGQYCANSSTCNRIALKRQ
jgi:hypothetical protein